MRRTSSGSEGGTEVAVRTARYARALRDVVAKQYGVELKGSWSTNEYHAMARGANTMSFSDVDFVGNSESFESKRCVEAAAQLADAMGIELLGGVSLREAQEVRAMWSLRGGPENLSEAQVRRFLRFWTLVAIAEATRPRVGGLLDTEWEQYRTAKYFLRLWRTLALVRGARTSSWRETLLFAGRWLPCDVRRLTLQVKTGGTAVGDWQRIVACHMVALGNCLSWAANDTVMGGFVDRVTMEIVRGGAHDGRWFREAVTLARDIGGYTPEWQKVVCRLVKKAGE